MWYGELLWVPWGKANSIRFYSPTVRTPKLSEIMNWLKPAIAIRQRKLSVRKMAAFPPLRTARRGDADNGGTGPHAAWRTSLLTREYKTSLKWELGLHPVNFWFLASQLKCGFLSHALIQNHFEAALLIWSLSNFLDCTQSKHESTLSVFPWYCAGLSLIRFLSLNTKSFASKVNFFFCKGRDKNFCLWGDHTLSLVLSQLCCCVPKADAENT